MSEVRIVFPGKGEDRQEAAGNQYPRFCELNIPYPEPRVVASNRYYAELLLEDYAGPLSELTAIHQYTYHDFTFHDEYPDLARLEECIAIVEMRHLELLAETVLLLGADPRFWYARNNSYVYWNASFPYYGDNVCDRLAADIAAEEGAIKQYRAHQAEIKDPYINELLQRIILDEKHHLGLFTEAYKKYCRRK